MRSRPIALRFAALLATGVFLMATSPESGAQETRGAGGGVRAPSRSAPARQEPGPRASETPPRAAEPSAPARPEAPPPGGSVLDALAGRDLYHGNYCGYGDRGGSRPPVDALDEACKRHDECWGRTGYKSCACDRNLEFEALALANDPSLSRDVRARAASIGSAFQVLACTRP